MKNREQRTDQVLMSCHVVEWQNIFTMFEGKLDLRMDWCRILGQARRRVSAILDAQPWRDFTVIMILSVLLISSFLEMARIIFL